MMPLTTQDVTPDMIRGQACSDKAQQEVLARLGARSDDSPATNTGTNS